jgi:hypothetical protein
MKRPIESDYISLTAYTRALEAYCDRQDRIRRAEEAFEASQQIIQSYLEKDNSQQEQSAERGGEPAPVQQEQGEPVGKWTGKEVEWTENPYKFKQGQSLYTTPNVPEGRQQRPSLRDIEPLTDEQVQDAIDAWFKPDRNGHYTNTFQERMRAAIEAAHGIESGTDVKENT